MNELIISGPSGAGKDTLIDMWIERNPRIKRVVTATTRAPRPNEVGGVHYHFYSHEEIQNRIDNDEFLEHMNVFGNIYGTPKSSVQSIVDNGDVAIIRIDVQGAIDVMPKLPNATTIFVLPPSLEELRRRLTERGTDSPEKIEERMDTAIAEIICSQLYDCQIVNDDRETAVQQLEDILSGQVYEDSDLAMKCMWMQHNERTHEKIDQFLALAAERGVGFEYPV